MTGTCLRAVIETQEIQMFWITGTFSMIVQHSCTPYRPIRPVGPKIRFRSHVFDFFGRFCACFNTLYTITTMAKIGGPKNNPRGSRLISGGARCSPCAPESPNQTFVHDTSFQQERILEIYCAGLRTHQNRHCPGPTPLKRMSGVTLKNASCPTHKRVVSHTDNDMEAKGTSTSALAFAEPAWRTWYWARDIL